MKKISLIFAALLGIIVTANAQNPADLATTPAVQETQNVQSDIMDFPEDALTKSMNASLAKQGKALGTINSDGSIYVIGAATTARPSNMSGFINSRNVAYSIAEMTAKIWEFVYKDEQSVGEDGRIHIRGRAYGTGAVTIPFKAYGKEFRVKIKVTE